MTIEMKLVALWILVCVTLIVHHFIVENMMEYKLKKLKDEMGI